MQGKGLCSSCVKDKDCIFSGKSPVWECEEHSFGKAKAGILQGKEVKYEAVSKVQDSEDQE